MLAAIVMGSNQEAEQALGEARLALQALGKTQHSAIYALPDRTGQGPLYLNQALLLEQNSLSKSELKARLRRIEADCGRVRPSRWVRLDLDLIAVGPDVAGLTLLGQWGRWSQCPEDVRIPLGELWRPAGVD